jgi:hypothetical protein
MNALSFSLYGNAPKYNLGMIRNAELAPKVYPGWKVFVFIDPSVPPAITERLVDLGCVLAGEDMNVPPMMRRFLVADFPSVERFIVRDADSRISTMEADAVNEWIQEDTIIHTCRAHPAHCRPMNGGLWGAQWRRPNWAAPNMMDLIQTYLDMIAQSYHGHDPDQHFINQMIWDWGRISCTQHDSVCRHCFPGSKDFPTPWPKPRFMGEVWEIDADGNEFPRPGDWEQIQ